MDIVYRHIEFVTWILSIVTSLLLLSITASMLSHVHHRIAQPLGPPYLNSCPDQAYISNKTKHFSFKGECDVCEHAHVEALKRSWLGLQIYGKKTYNSVNLSGRLKDTGNHSYLKEGGHGKISADVLDKYLALV